MATPKERRKSIETMEGEEFADVKAVRSKKCLHVVVTCLSSDMQCSLTRNQNLARRDSELDIKLRKDAHRMLDTRGPKETGQSKTNRPRRRDCRRGGCPNVVVAVSALSLTLLRTTYL